MWTILFGCVDGTAPARSVADFDNTPVPKRNVPLLGGGVAANVRWVAASDVDGDRVRFVEMSSEHIHDIALPAGWAPTQVAWTVGHTTERLHVLLRGTGAVAVIDGGATTADPLLVDVRPVCEAPRGLAWDLDRERMWVACGGGQLVGLDATGATVETFLLDPDLRDVVMVGDGRALVSRTKAAEVLVVDLDAGSITARYTPPVRQIAAAAGRRIPRVLRRLVADGSGGALALYQLHDDGPIDVDPNNPGDPTEPPDDRAPAYGSDGLCGSLVTTAVAPVHADGGFSTETWLDSAQSGYPVDVGMDASGEKVFATTRGLVARLGDGDALELEDGSALCLLLTSVEDRSGVGTAVGRAGARLWGATREPFAVWNGASFTQTGTPIDEPETPLQLFHHEPAGISCASCHFDGDEDGHTWQFVPDGPRRTQPVGGLVISETAPFHWDATLPSFEQLFTVVGEGRMGLSATNTDALLGWMDGLDRPPRVHAEPSAAARGEVVFAEAGCATCHSGWRYTNGASEDVGTGGAFQVPSLIGVGARAPLMHDGCAPTLLARFEDEACGGGDQHGVTSGLSSEDLAALVAYLQSL